MRTGTKDIGLVLKERLAEMEHRPNALVWSNILAQQQNERSKRRKLWAWLIALLTVGLIGLLIFFLNNNTYKLTEGEIPAEIVQPQDVDKTDIPSSKQHMQETTPLGADHDQDDAAHTADSVSNRPTGAENSNKNGQNTPSVGQQGGPYSSYGIPRTSSYYLNNRYQPSKRASNRNGSYNSNNRGEIFESGSYQDAYNLHALALDSKGLILPPMELKADLRIKPENVSVERTDEMLTKKFEIIALSGPILYAANSGTLLGDQFVERAAQTSTNLSYGAYLSYQMTEKLALRIGVTRWNSEITIPNIAIGENQPNALFANVDLAGSFDPSSLASDNSIDMVQTVTYLETPIEFVHHIYGNQFSIYAVTGLSTLYLNENRVFADIGERILLGANRNYLNLGISGNLGLGLHYRASENLFFQLEPMFKYHLKTLEKVNGGAPYTFGIQTGLRVRL